jgi:hypothetical protein
MSVVRVVYSCMQLMTLWLLSILECQHAELGISYRSNAAPTISWFERRRCDT